MHPLRQWRKRHKVTLQEMARQIGLSTWIVHRIETGKRRALTLSEAVAIERATGRQVTLRRLAQML